MIYADQAFYTTNYLVGKEAVISAADFPLYSRKASQIIKVSTLGNINEGTTVIEEVKMCCCELAEHLYKQDVLIKSGNGIASEKVGEYSVSYVDIEKAKASSIADVNSIVCDWLLMTGLMYRGGL